LHKNGSLEERYEISMEPASFSAFSAHGSYAKAIGNELLYYESGLVEKLEEEKHPRVVLLANSVDRPLALDFIGFLEEKGITVEHIDASGFPHKRNARRIIILGGQKAPEGIGEVVSGLLTDEEQAYLKGPGNSGVFVKRDMWLEDQVVVIIAGSGRDETATAHLANKARILDELV
ncbi:MAG: hypothetical protein V3T58_05855, partial [Candidatus Hydrothermarchaeales archaeon]